MNVVDPDECDGGVALRIASAQTQYYESQGGKNKLFGKRAQKQDCAASVCRELSMDVLLESAIRVASANGASYVVVDYTVLKAFAHPGNFEAISNYGLILLQRLIGENGRYEVHFNLKGFTASGMERYSGLIESFFRCMNTDDTSLCECLSRLVIYNSPSFFSMLHQMVARFITSDTSRIETLLMTRDESDAKFQEVLDATY